MKTMAETLAGDPRVSDYDIWRAEKNLDVALFDIPHARRPIPVRILRWPAIMRGARRRRLPR